MSARISLELPNSATEPQPYPFEKVRPAFLQAGQGIAGIHRTVPFTWNGQAAGLSFSAMADPCPAGWVARVKFDGHELAVRIERMPEISALATPLAGLELESLPAELACGVLAAAFETGLHELKGKGVDLSLEELLPQAAAESPPVESISWAVHRGADPAWMRGTLSGSDNALQHLAKVLARVPAQPVRQYADLPVALALVAARTHLSQEEFRELKRSDAILAELADWRTTGTCEVLVSGRRFATATLRDTTLTIQQLTMTEPSPSPAASEPLTSVDQLEVELTFLVGTHTATLEQLRSLAPGACIELATPVAQAVTICANGKPVGRGELLDIGSRIGVRITELAAS